MYKAIYAGVSDLIEDGPDRVVEFIRESGANTITLAVTSMAEGPGASAPRGTVRFHVRPQRYGHIKPRVDPGVSEWDPLAELQRAAPDLDRAAWLAGCLDVPADAGDPRYASRNALGRAYPHRLCPAHPAVRDYVVNLCSDLAHGYDLAAVVLEAPGWLPLDLGHDTDFAGAPLDRYARALLALCFADITRRAARAVGIDADALQAEARAWLERYRDPDLREAGGMAAAFSFADLVRGPAWTAFLEWRCRLVADLATEIKAALPVGTALVVVPGARHDGVVARLDGSDPAMLARAADALEIPVHAARPDEIGREAEEARRRAGEAAALRFVLRPGPEDDGEAMAPAVRGLGEVGIAGLAFYDYKRVRLTGAATVKAALQALQPA